MLRKLWKSFITSEAFFFFPTIATAYGGASWVQSNWASAVNPLAHFPFTQKWVATTPDFSVLCIAFLSIMNVFLIIRTWGLTHLLKPKLKCAFSMDDPGCFHADVPMNFSNGTSILTKFYRLKVCADSVGLVPSCAGHLVSIVREQGGIVFNGENLALTFAPASAPNPTVKDIRDAIPEYLDVLCISQANQVMITTENFQYPTSIASALQGISSAPGDYILHIVASSPISASVEINLLLKWTGNWETASIGKISH